MAASSDAIPMPYSVFETNQQMKDEKIVNKGIKNKNRKRNNANTITESNNETKNV